MSVCYPLRNIDLREVSHNGQKGYLLVDKASWLEPIFITPLGAVILECLSFCSTLKELRQLLKREYGLKVSQKQISEFYQMIASQGWLADHHALELLSKQSVHPAYFAGRAYPKEPEKLEAFVASFLQETEPLSYSPQVLVVPHIDLNWGKETYRSVFSKVRPHLRNKKRFIILGISHDFTKQSFIFSEKDFETPLGCVRTDKRLVEELTMGYPLPFQDEWNHFGEHSVEFVLPFLQVLGPEEFEIAPILCGSLHRELFSGENPAEREGYQAFLDNLAKVLREDPEVMLVVSVDLAHVGSRFGQEALDDGDRKGVKKRDLETLQELKEGRAEGFLQELRQDKISRNYCGTPALYATLKATELALDLPFYQQCCDPDGKTMVTVAGGWNREKV